MLFRSALAVAGDANLAKEQAKQAALEAFDTVDVFRLYNPTTTSTTTLMGPPVDFSQHGADWNAGECGAKRAQSPINFNSLFLPKTGTFGYFYNFIHGQNITMMNDGRHISIDVTGQGFGGVQIPGAKAPWYNLKQINFHAKSEHTLRGKHFPIEVQLVHQASSIESPMVGNEQVTVSFFVESDSPPEVVENFPGRRLDSRRKRDKAMASGASATKGAGKLRQGQGQKARETSLVQEKTLSAGKAGMFLREGSSGLPEIVVNEGGALQEVLEAILFQPLQPDVIDSAWFGDQLQPWDMNVGMDAAPALKMALLNGQAVVANTALFLTDPAPGYTKALHIRVKVWPWWQAGAGGMLASGKYMAPGIGEKGFNADFQHFVAKPPRSS